MPIIQARYNAETKTYRCGLEDCGALLAKGENVKGRLEIKCKCGVLNNVTESTVDNSKSEPYQNRMGMRKK